MNVDRIPLERLAAIEAAPTALNMSVAEQRQLVAAYRAAFYLAELAGYVNPHYGTFFTPKQVQQWFGGTDLPPGYGELVPLYRETPIAQPPVVDAEWHATDQPKDSP
jgi:hypothetical protein